MTAVVGAIRDAEARQAPEARHDGRRVVTGRPIAKPVGPTPLDSSITPLIATLTFGGRLFGRAMTRAVGRRRAR